MPTLSRYSDVAGATLTAGEDVFFAQRGYHPNGRLFSANEVVRQPRPITADLTRGTPCRPTKDQAAWPA